MWRVEIKEQGEIGERVNFLSNHFGLSRTAVVKMLINRGIKDVMAGFDVQGESAPAPPAPIAPVSIKLAAPAKPRIVEEYTNPFKIVVHKNNGTTYFPLDTVVMALGVDRDAAMSLIDEEDIHDVMGFQMIEDLGMSTVIGLARTSDVDVELVDKFAEWVKKQSE